MFDLENWATPTDLPCASGMPTDTKRPVTDSVGPEPPKTSQEIPPSTEPQAKQVPLPDEKGAGGASDKGGLDPKLLLGLLGNQMSDSNPGMGAILGMLNGEKPDMMSLLPLIMQMGAQKKDDKNAGGATLDDFTIVN